MRSSAVSQVFGDCLPGLFSKILPQFSSLLQNTGWGQMFRTTNLTAGSLLPNLHQHNHIASPEAAETSSRQRSGRCGSIGDTTGMAFFNSSNKFGISVFSDGGHDILLKISNARGGFCPLVIINLKYGSQNTQKSPSITCFTKPKGLLMQTLAWNPAHGLYKPLVYRQAHPLAVVSLEYYFSSYTGLSLQSHYATFFLTGKNICKY